MYKYFFHKSPNTYKVAIFLEEADLEYQTVFVDVARGEQFTPEFVALSPNCKVPVLIDDQPTCGGGPLVLFESAAILLYLGEKTKLFLPTEIRSRADVIKWLMWHAVSQSPMNGQCAHFNIFAPDVVYARDRYNREVRRLLKVLDGQLESREFVAGDAYSVADMACYPWLGSARVALGLENLSDFPQIERWFESIERRPAVVAAYERLNRDDTGSWYADLESFTQNMFGFSAEQAKKAAQNARGLVGPTGLSGNTSQP